MWTLKEVTAHLAKTFGGTIVPRTDIYHEIVVPAFGGMEQYGLFIMDDYALKKKNRCKISLLSLVDYRRVIYDNRLDYIKPPSTTVGLERNLDAIAADVSRKVVNGLEAGLFLKQQREAHARYIEYTDGKKIAVRLLKDAFPDVRITDEHSEHESAFYAGAGIWGRVSKSSIILDRIPSLSHETGIALLNILKERN